MKEVTREITKEEYDIAQEKGPYGLIDDAIKIGYGAYYARTYEKDGSYFLKFEMGDSCD